MPTIVIIKGREIIQDNTGRIFWTAGAEIDADGSPHAYCPQDTGLDFLENARDGSQWCGIVTIDGVPYVAPSGFYVSTTSYQWESQPIVSPARYVNAELVPYVVVSPLIRARASGVVLGCKARITNIRTKQVVDAVVADFGGSEDDDEISIAAAQALSIPSSPKTGGTSDPILSYELWPGVHAVVNGVTYNLIPMRIS